MPLIRAIRRSFGRRGQDMDAYGSEPQFGTYSQGNAWWLWLVAFIVLLPLVAFLVVVGLLYELVIRLDRGRRLPAAVVWLISSAAALAIVVGVGALLLRYLR